MSDRAISESDLCAYVDGRLDGERLATVEAGLLLDEAQRARAGDWRAQATALRALFDPVLDEPVPARLLLAAGGRAERPGRPASAWRWAAAVAWLALGAVLGYGVRDYRGATDPAAVLHAGLARQAAIAHAVYVPEVRHPVEVGADQQAHLTGWLSKRLGTPVTAPLLEADGYRLMGGRLLPSEAGPGAQFMYQDDEGHRLTLYLNHDRDKVDDTAFRYAEVEGIAVFYWVDGGTGYALSAALPRERLLAIAGRVYRQLNP
ncbi:MAG: anti-sigma factor [Rhodocyclaceae bacterium]|nr:anti-sigma factor [Rhodocyclaceae bacterium]